MSRSPLQGRVEEIIIREPKPSWGSRVGDVLGDVFSGIGAAVREYGPAVLQGLANASSLYSNSSSAYQPYDISPSSLPDYSSSSRTVRIQAPEPIKSRPLPEPRQTPKLMEAYGRSLQQLRDRRHQQIEEVMAINAQAANRRGITQSIVQNLGMSNLSNSAYGSHYQAPIDVHSSKLSSLISQNQRPQSPSSGRIQENPINQGYAGQQPKSYAEMFKAQAEAEAYRQAGLLQRKDPFEPLLKKVRDPFAPPGPEQYYYEPVQPAMELKPLPKDYKQKADDLRSLGNVLKQHETSFRKTGQGFDSVDAVQVLATRATALSNNNPEVFLNLMNEVLLGSDVPWIRFQVVGIYTGSQPGIRFGDLGMNPIYQDGTINQMYHFWSYVNYGYYLPKDAAKVGNVIHEYHEPTYLGWLTGQPPGAKEDYRLSVVGYNIGQALQKGHIKPSELARKLDQYLRTDKYNEVSEDDKWLKKLP